MSFASAIGLMVASPSPTWRDTSVWLALLSGFWIIVVAVGSFALGGYLAGRVRSTWKASEDEVEFRDGAHGLLVWALGVVIGAAMLWATASTLTAVNSATATPREPPARRPSSPTNSIGYSARSAASTRSRRMSVPKRAAS